MKAGDCHPDCAHYRCCACGHVFRMPTGLWDCTRCKHPYIVWTNYEAWKAAHPWMELLIDTRKGNGDG